MFAYRFIPKHDYKFKKQIPGALFGAVACNIVSIFYSLYIELFTGFSLMYGSLTTVVLAMLWIYACMYSILLGAAINKTIIENKKLTKYKGNYDAYVAQRTLNMEAYEKQYEKQQKEIKRTQEFIDKNIVRASTTKQAQSRRKQLEKMVKLEKPEKENVEIKRETYRYNNNVMCNELEKAVVLISGKGMSDMDIERKLPLGS